jgi:proteasome lid subunit RPN8/RPN11
MTDIDRINRLPACLPESAARDALKHALDLFPEEAVGYVARGMYFPLRNRHDTPTEAFEVNSNDTLAAFEDGMTILIHSHTNGQISPSMRDMQQQELMAVPWGIIVLDAGRTIEENGQPQMIRWTFFGDELPIPALIERQHLWNVYDCYTLVRDYYRLERDVVLPIYPREPHWEELKIDMIEPKLAEAGFQPVALAELQKHDVLCMKIGRNSINHLAVYTGDELMVHHLASRASRHEPITRWLNHFHGGAWRYVGKQS